MADKSGKIRIIDFGEDFGPVLIKVNGVGFTLWPDGENVRVTTDLDDNVTVDVTTGGPIRVGNPDGSMQVIQRAPNGGPSARWEFKSLQPVQGGPKPGPG